MRVFVAGATGVIGRHLVPMLVETGHEVAAMTRSPDKTDALRAQGADPVVCDVFDRARLTETIGDIRPEVIVHELTDLPDDAASLPLFMARNARIRREGVSNLLKAAELSGVDCFVGQSVAWELDGDGAAAVAEMEAGILDFGGLVIRYGQFYGPGTYYERELPPPPRIRVEEAARRTMASLEMSSGVLTLADE